MTFDRLVPRLST